MQNPKQQAYRKRVWTPLLNKCHHIGNIKADKTAQNRFVLVTPWWEQVFAGEWDRGRMDEQNSQEENERHYETYLAVQQETRYRFDSQFWKMTRTSTKESLPFVSHYNLIEKEDATRLEPKPPVPKSKHLNYAAIGLDRSSILRAWWESTCDCTLCANLLRNV